MDSEARFQALKILCDRGFITRRQFLMAAAGLGASAAAAGYLAACGGTAATPTTGAVPTTAPAATATTATLAPTAVSTTPPSPTKGVVATPTASGILLPPSTALEGKGEVVIGSWGGTFEEAMKKAFDPTFEKYYKGKAIYSGPYDYGKAKAMVEAKTMEWDVSLSWEFDVLRGIKEGILQKLDYSLLPAAQELDKNSVQEYSVGGDYEVWIIAYNKERYGNNPPTSWADFFDTEKFPGARALENDAASAIDAALLADGIPADQLNEAHKQPDTLDRAFKKLEKFKASGSLKKFWTTGGEGQQLIKDKEVDMINHWNGRISSLIVNGADHIGMEWNQGIYYISTYFWFTGAPNGKNGLAYLNTTCTAEAQAALCETIQYGPTNPKAVPLISESVRKYLPSHPDNFKKILHQDVAYWADTLPTIDARWQAFVQS